MFLCKKVLFISVLVIAIFNNTVFAKNEQDFSNIMTSNELVIMTENWPPLNYVKNEQLEGPAVDIVKEIQRKLNEKSAILVLPWKRSYSYILERKNTILFSMVYSQKRKDKFKWVGPIAQKRYSLYSKKDFNHTILSLDDAQPFIIGVQRGGFSEEFLEEKGFIHLAKANYASQNIQKLIRSRFDLLFESHSTYLTSIKQSKIKENDFKEVFVVKKSLMYIAFNKETDDNIVLQWQNAYDELYENGTIKKIYQKYDAEGLYWQKDKAIKLN